MRVSSLLPVSLILILLLPVVTAENKQVELSIETSIADYDIGITNAATAPDGSSVLILSLIHI